MVPIVGKQLVILVLWIALSAIVIGVFAWVMGSTRHPRDFSEVQHRGYRLRRGWGWFYGALLLVAFAATIWTIPYTWAQSADAARPALVVRVVAHQFSFTMPSRLPAGRRIEFRVASGDVNHGFGIYDPQGVLVAQVQAMPDYTNVLYFTFSKPGTYTIRCLEYCGVDHSDMHQSLEVYLPPSTPGVAAGGA